MLRSSECHVFVCVFPFICLWLCLLRHSGVNFGNGLALFRSSKTPKTMLKTIPLELNIHTFSLLPQKRRATHVSRHAISTLGTSTGPGIPITTMKTRTTNQQIPNMPFHLCAFQTSPPCCNPLRGSAGFAKRKQFTSGDHSGQCVKHRSLKRSSDQLPAERHSLTKMNRKEDVIRCEIRCENVIRCEKT